MNLAEKILVVLDVETNYNLCPGGKGGFGYINANVLSIEDRKKNGMIGYEKIKHKLGLPGRKMSEEHKIRLRESLKGLEGSFKGKKHSSDTKFKMSQSKKGLITHMKDKMWVVRRDEVLLIKKDDFDHYQSLGFKRGKIDRKFCPETIKKKKIKKCDRWFMKYTEYKFYSKLYKRYIDGESYREIAKSLGMKHETIYMRFRIYKFDTSRNIKSGEKI